jgi:hypothetical protein
MERGLRLAEGEYHPAEEAVGMSDQDAAEKAAAAVCRYYDASPKDVRPVAAIIRWAYSAHAIAEFRRFFRTASMPKPKRARRKPLDAVGVPLAGGKGKIAHDDD